MNFFAHAVAAAWSRSDPGFTLGAMLPDLAAMLGDRVLDADDGDLLAGIEHHHAADRAFHRLPPFCARSMDLTARLRARGVGRGGALAAGHVGIELLLDGVLLEREPAGRERFESALAAAPAAAAAIRWRGGGARFLELARHLASSDLLPGYREPSTVADRLVRILARRPRLRLEAGDRAPLVEELARQRPLLAAAAPGLLARLAGDLGVESPRIV